MSLREHLETWFRSRGFEISDGSAAVASGYGEGGIVVDLADLEDGLAVVIMQAAKRARDDERAANARLARNLSTEPSDVADRIAKSIEIPF